MQTQPMIDLPPVVAPPPARPLMKLYPMFSMNMPGMMMKSGDRSDTGILRKDDDGRSKAARADGVEIEVMLWVSRRVAVSFAGLAGGAIRSMVMTPSEASSPSLSWNRKLVVPAFPAGW